MQEAECTISQQTGEQAVLKGITSQLQEDIEAGRVELACCKVFAGLTLYGSFISIAVPYMLLQLIITAGTRAHLPGGDGQDSWLYHGPQGGQPGPQGGSGRCQRGAVQTVLNAAISSI